MLLVGVVTDLGLRNCKDAHGLNVDKTRRCVEMFLRAAAAVESKEMPESFGPRKVRDESSSKPAKSDTCDDVQKKQAEREL